MLVTICKQVSYRPTPPLRGVGGRIQNSKFIIPHVLPLVLRPDGDEFASLDEFLEFEECGVAATFADAPSTSPPTTA